MVCSSHRVSGSKGRAYSFSEEDLWFHPGRHRCDISQYVSVCVLHIQKVFHLENLIFQGGYIGIGRAYVSVRGHTIMDDGQSRSSRGATDFQGGPGECPGPAPPKWNPDKVYIDMCVCVCVYTGHVHVCVICAWDSKCKECTYKYLITHWPGQCNLFVCVCPYHRMVVPLLQMHVWSCLGRRLTGLAHGRVILTSVWSWTIRRR